MRGVRAFVCKSTLGNPKYDGTFCKRSTDVLIANNAESMVQEINGLDVRPFFFRFGTQERITHVHIFQLKVRFILLNRIFTAA